MKSYMINLDANDLTKKKKTIAMVGHRTWLTCFTGTEWTNNDRTKRPLKFHDFGNCEFHDATRLFDSI